MSHAVDEPPSAVPSDVAAEGPTPAVAPSAEPTPASDAATGAAPTALDAVRGMVEGSTAAILAAFEDKLARDRHRETLIDRMHAELQGHKNDLVGQATRPLKQGIIRLHDDLGKTLDHYRKQGVAELTPERAVDLLTNFQSQVEIVLEEGGVTAFREEGERFQARRQKALRTMPTDDAERVGLIAERVRPGFEEGTTVHEKERVAVYALAPKAAPAPAPAPAPQNEPSQ